MANQRAKDQQLLPFAAKRQFVSEMDAGLRQIGISNRSQFIRDAIMEKLAKEKIHIPRHLAAAPGRTQSATPGSYTLNESANSNTSAHASHLAALAGKVKPVSYKKKASKKIPSSKTSRSRCQ